MGCDIHIYVEKFDGKKWRSADKWVQEEYDKTEVTNYPQVYEGRNYELFAILAGVRNGYGIKPIVERRGLPDDLSNEVSSTADHWIDDGHSHSWLTLKELVEFDWSFVIRVDGLVGVNGYREFKEKGKPSTYWAAGGGEEISNEEMEKLAASDKKYGDFEGPSTRVYWNETGYEAAGSFINDTIPKLDVIRAGDSNEHVRIVFWFDS